jgi:hypothetical protein
LRHGRRDSTHATIRDGLRRLGCTVHDTADLGGDFPDLVVGHRGLTYLLEVKRPGGKLRSGQVAAMRAWRGGPWLRVESLSDVLVAIGFRSDVAA